METREKKLDDKVRTGIMAVVPPREYFHPPVVTTS
jgi:hypothetical protein